MANNPGFLSPRSDLTIRGVPSDKMEALMNAAVDILGGRVEFSETAIYESEQTSYKAKHCGLLKEHPHHGWTFNNVNYACPGNAPPTPSWALCPDLRKHTVHNWWTEKAEYRCPGRVVGLNTGIPCSRKSAHETHYWGSEGDKLCPGLEHG